MSLIPHLAAPHSRTTVSYSNTPIYGFTTCTQHHRVIVYSKYTASTLCVIMVVSELEMTVGHCLTNFRIRTTKFKNYTHYKLINDKSLIVYSNVPTVNE